MKLFRIVFVVAAAAAFVSWVRDAGAARRTTVLRRRLELGGGLGHAGLAASPVAETVWTPAEPSTEPRPRRP